MQPINRVWIITLVLVVPIVILAACQIVITPTEPLDLVQLQQLDAAGNTANPVVTWMPRFNEQGELVRPDGFGFREEWVYIGTPLTPNDLNNGKAAFPEFHNVYMEPMTFRHFKETGEVLEGAMIVKELLSVGDTKAPSGNGYFMGDFLGLEVAVKSNERFSDEPGNWAYFSWTNEEAAGGPLKNAATAFPAESCNSCHAMFAEYDQIFAQYYPVLRAANPAVFASPNAGFPDEMLEAVAAMMADSKDAPMMTMDEMTTFVDLAALEAIAVEDQLPRGAENLLPYLQEVGYGAWLAEPEIHPSTGPHGFVRSFMNSVLETSIDAGNGVSLCVSCHALSTNDYVLSIVPFE
jgi:hypothetical protein